MAGIVGSFVDQVVFGEANAAFSSELNSLTEAEYAPAIYDEADWDLGGNYSAWRHTVSNRWAVQGQVMPGFMHDYYYRIHVTPAAINLGNLVSAQQRSISVWNAYPDAAHELEGTSLLNGEGIEVTAPGALPISFTPLQERQWLISVGSGGPPLIDASLVFEFVGFDGMVVTITGQRMLAWPVPPDWATSVNETLTWSTHVEQPIEGEEDRKPLMGAPRRRWEFAIFKGNRERRILESLLFDWTSRIWALAVWTDITWLASPMTAGATEILLDPSGLDYHVGGLVMLWSDVNRYELVEVSDVLSDRLVLLRPTLQTWARGSRVYPCRTARLVDAPDIRRSNDRVITTDAVFDSAEPCDWPAIAPSTMYLGYPVLEHRRAENEDPTASYPRQTVVIDGDVGLIEVDDISNRSWPRQSHAWVLKGREQRAAHRSLLYWLQGRAEALWVPTGTDDLTLLEVVGASETQLVVEWCGVAQFLRAQAGRRHFRMTLRTGQVLHAEVIDAVVIDQDSEQLLLSAPLGLVIEPSQVAQICWMMLARQESDRVEIAHEHDVAGVATVSTAFVGLGDEEP